MTIIDLLGVVENGAPRAVDIPPNVSQPIELTKFQDVTIRLTVKTASGVLVDLTNKTIVFTMRANSRDTQNIIRKTGVTNVRAGRGRSDITIVTTDTKFRAPMRYLYDVWMTDTQTSERTQIIPLSTSVLRAGFQPP